MSNSSNEFPEIELVEVKNNGTKKLSTKRTKKEKNFRLEDTAAQISELSPAERFEFKKNRYFTYRKMI